jgi:hypothetical protein
VNRSISVTAVAALLVLSAQAAFADTSSDGAKIAAPVLTGTAVVAAAPSTTAISMPAPVRVRHAARIPGTFALADATTEGNPFEVYGVLLPPMTGGA